ncbi:unnamed protein product, partial [Staurois parvus]
PRQHKNCLPLRTPTNTPAPHPGEPSTTSLPLRLRERHSSSQLQTSPRTKVRLYIHHQAAPLRSHLVPLVSGSLLSSLLLGGSAAPLKTAALGKCLVVNTPLHR